MDLIVVFPCFIFPDRILDILFAIERLKFINPKEVEVIQKYHWIVNLEIARLAPLENLYLTATEVVNGSNNTKNYFKKSLNLYDSFFKSSFERAAFFNGQQSFPNSGEDEIHSKSQPISMSLPAFDIPFRGIDICGLERAARTEQALSCLDALSTSPHYAITDIYNTDKAVSRRACVNDRIEIRGSNLGTFGEISFGERIIVETESWNEELIVFIVPPLAEGKELRLCIDPGLTECVGLPYYCRYPSSDAENNLELEILRPITEERISLTVSGDTVEETSSSQFLAEACTPISLTVEALFADNASVSNDGGDVIWTLGDESTITIVEGLREDTEFTLIASNLCNRDDPFERTIRLEINYNIHVPESTQVDIGDQTRIDLTVSCEAPVDGITLNLEIDDPSKATTDVSSIVIPEGENTTSFIVDGINSGRAELTLITDPSGRYERKSVAILIAPVITNDSPIESWINEPISIEARGLLEGRISLLFPGSVLPVPAMVMGNTAIANIPEYAEDGNVQIVYSEIGSEIRSSNSVDLTINDPIVTNEVPLIGRRETMLNLEGFGFSNAVERNDIRIFGVNNREFSVEPDLSSARRLSFTLPSNTRLTENSLEIIVSPSPGIERESTSYELVVYRESGTFRNAAFNNTPNIYNCGGNPIIEIDPPTPVMIGNS